MRDQFSGTQLSSARAVRVWVAVAILKGPERVSRENRLSARRSRVEIPRDMSMNTQGVGKFREIRK